MTIAHAFAEALKRKRNDDSAGLNLK